MTAPAIIASWIAASAIVGPLVGCFMRGPAIRQRDQQQASDEPVESRSVAGGVVVQHRSANK